jgi:hypothetical protein
MFTKTSQLRISIKSLAVSIFRNESIIQEEQVKQKEQDQQEEEVKQDQQNQQEEQVGEIEIQDMEINSDNYTNEQWRLITQIDGRIF